MVGQLMGRPSKHTEAAEAAILTAVMEGDTLKVAAAKGGVTYTTMREWVLSSPAFSDALEKAESVAQSKLLATVVKASVVGNRTTRPDGTVIEGPGAWQAAAWVLERRWPKEYARHEKVDMAIDIRTALERMTDDPAERDAAVVEANRIIAEARP